VDIYLYFETGVGFNPTCQVIASIQFKTQWEVPVFLQHNRLTHDEFGPLPKKGAFVCRLPKLPLPSATYRIAYSIIADRGYGVYFDAIDDALELTVMDGDFFGSGEVPPPTHGCCLVPASWRVEKG
jgi:lipopolysaccharide transport system ATP-binding protein